MHTPEFFTLPEGAVLHSIGGGSADDLAGSQRTVAAQVCVRWRTRRANLDGSIAGGGDAALATGGRDS